MGGLFAVMCLIWGATWLAMKVGVASVPPVFFAGTRFVVAGLVMLLLAGLRGEVRRLTRAQPADARSTADGGADLCPIVLGHPLCALRPERCVGSCPDA